MNQHRRPRLGRCFYCLALILLLSACAHQPDRPYPAHLASTFQIENVPFFAQDTNQCGPAALATMLQFRGIDVTPKQLEPSLYIPAKQGTLAIELAAHARRYGLYSYPLRPDLTALLTELAAGHPVLVFQNLGLSWWPQYHFAVVVGYDLERGLLTLRSGLEAEHTTKIRSFINTWRRTDRWARVMSVPDDLPATAEPLPFLKAISSLEQTGQLDAAKLGYEASQSRWADNAEIQLLANLGLANIAYQQTRYQDAAAHLQQAITRQPEAAIAWNNLAYALDAQGCPQTAQRAVECAASLAPDDPNIQDSLTEFAENDSRRRETAQACPRLTCPVH